MKVDMNWRPVALVTPRSIWSWAGTGASTLYEKEKLRAFRAQDDNTRIRLRDLLEGECLTVKANSLFETGNVNTDGYRDHMSSAA
jgi:hypothetical protein